MTYTKIEVEVKPATETTPAVKEVAVKSTTEKVEKKSTLLSQKTIKERDIARLQAEVKVINDKLAVCE